MKGIKKIRTLLIAICLLAGTLLTHSVFADQSASISVSGATAEAGGTVSVTVSLQNLKEVSAIILSVSYDSGKLELLSVENGGLFNDADHTTDMTKNPYTLCWGSGVEKCNTSASGSAAVLTFQLLDGFTSGSTDVSVSVKDSCDMDLNTISFSPGSATGTISVKAHEHSFGSWTETEKATCLKEGEKKRTCTSCGYEEVVATEKTGHTAGAWETTQEATCTAAGVAIQKCTVCGEQLGEKELEMSAHKFDGKEEIIKEATCTEEGSKKVYCSGASCSESKTVAISKVDHTKGTEQVEKEATCTEAGKKVVKCTVCDAVISTKTISASGHSYGESIVEKEASCTKTGTEVQACEKCGDIKKTEIAAFGHSYGETVIEKEATCTEAGISYQRCERCGESKDVDLPALGHQYGESIIIKEATLLEEGESQKTCAVCQDTITETIPILSEDHEHDFTGDEEVVSEASCTEKGITCIHCVVEGCEAYKTLETPELGHQFGDWVITKEATTEEEGTQVRTCSVCQEKEETQIEKLLEQSNSETSDDENVSDDENISGMTDNNKSDTNKILTIAIFGILAVIGLAICIGSIFHLIRKY